MSFAKLSRRRAVQLMAMQVAAASAERTCAARLSPPWTPPNVVFVLADDVGYGDLACLGNRYIKTPHLDALHAESVRLTNFHVSPTCAPSRASLMTGRYSNATGVWHTVSGRSLIDPSNVTLAQCFRDSGYATGIFGKWHLGDNYPCRTIDCGFDESIVCGGGGIWQTPDYFGNDDRDDAYLHNGRPEKYLGFSTDIFFDRSMDFMERAQKTHRPFFCYLATPAAHQPVWALEKDLAPYTNVPGLSDPGFYGMIANIDSKLGQLRRFLEARGLTENTIVIYAGDNGGLDGVRVFNAGMRGEKASPYEGGHRVPFFISWPAGGVTGGRDVEALTAHIDLLPTLTDLCRLKLKGRLVDGRSLRPLLHGENSAWTPRTLVVDSQREDNLVKWKDTAVMTQRWRLVRSSYNRGRNELYDIEDDPGQTTDVAAAHPDVVRALEQEYELWWKRTSVLADHYVRIVLGSEHENPTKLTCMDWHGGNAMQVWNQRQIREAPAVNGFWAVEISRSGRYRFELRRWPRELDLAIDSAYDDPVPNMEKAAGVAISVKRAQLEIGSFRKDHAVLPGDKFAEFIVSLPVGSAEFHATFFGENETQRGAYYLYVERV